MRLHLFSVKSIQRLGIILKEPNVYLLFLYYVKYFFSVSGNGIIF